MRGGIGIDELVSAAKRAYLWEAVKAVAQQGGRANVSRLSVATGMTRKEVSSLLGQSPHGCSAMKRKIGEQRALRVLRGWLTDSRFHNRRGRPGELKYRGDKRSFSALVKLYGGDVTPKSVLRELQRIEVVDLTSTGAIRLRRSKSRSNMEVQYKLSDLSKAFEDFACAAVQSGSSSDANGFFEVRTATLGSMGAAAYFMRRFSRRAAALLEDFQRWSLRHESDTPVSREEREPLRAAVGVYLLRSGSESVSNAHEHTTAPVTVQRAGTRRTN